MVSVTANIQKSRKPRQYCVSMLTSSRRAQTNIITRYSLFVNNCLRLCPACFQLQTMPSAYLRNKWRPTLIRIYLYSWISFIELIIILIKTLFQEATHLTTRQSSMRASNNRKQLTNNWLMHVHVYIYIKLTSSSVTILLLHRRTATNHIYTHCIQGIVICVISVLDH